MNYIFIPGNVPSSKNSKTWTGRFLVSSKACQHYERDTKDYWKVMINEFLAMFFTKGQKSVKVGMYFVRKSKHRFDYINACQIIADLMTTNDWIEDDSAEFFTPVFLGFHHDTKNSGVYLVKLPNDLKMDEITRSLVSEIK